LGIVNESQLLGFGIREHRAAGLEQGRLPVLHLAQTSEVLVGRPGCRNVNEA
jgi:hypothetical protein